MSPRRQIPRAAPRLVALLTMAIALSALQRPSGATDDFTRIVLDAMSAGPSGPWTSTGFVPPDAGLADVVRVVRGLSGVGWGKGSAQGEYTEIFSGRVVQRPRFVQPVGGLDQENIMDFSIKYANPFMVTGLVSAGRLTDDIDPTFFNPDHGAWFTDKNRRILRNPYSIRDMDGIRIAISDATLDPIAWLQRFEETAKIFPPRRGSPGAQFLADVRGVLSLMRTEFDGIGHRIVNVDEVEEAYRALARRYGYRGTMSHGHTVVHTAPSPTLGGDPLGVSGTDPHGPSTGPTGGRPRRPRAPR